MSEPSTIRHAILELASEDFYGLWEICWKVAELLAAGEEGVVEPVQRALDELERAQQIGFYVRKRPEDEPIPVAAHDVDWRAAVTPEPPKPSEMQILVASSDSAPRRSPGPSGNPA